MILASHTDSSYQLLSTKERMLSACTCKYSRVALNNESTEVPNTRLCSVPHKETNTHNSWWFIASYSGTEVVLNRPGYFCVTTYTVA